MNQQEIFLIGAGGHSSVIAEAISLKGEFKIKAFIDRDSMKIVDTNEVSYPQLESLKPSKFIVAIGSNDIRKFRYNQMLELGWSAATIIHPGAIVSELAEIGAGSFIAAGAIVNCNAKVGVNCIVNSGAIIEHHCTVGSHSHVAPGAILGGAVQIGESALVGLGAKVLPGCSLGQSSVLGAGAVLTGDLENDQAAFGVPARVRSEV